MQTILGHKHIDTTVNYARLYDSIVATGYFLAMDAVESGLDPGLGADQVSIGGHPLALVGSLQVGTLSRDQRETICALRSGIPAFATHEDELL